MSRRKPQFGALLPFPVDEAAKGAARRVPQERTFELYRIRRCEGCGRSLTRLGHTNAVICDKCTVSDTIAALRRRLAAAYADHWRRSPHARALREEAVARAVVAAFADFESSYHTFAHVLEAVAAWTRQPQIAQLAQVFGAEMAEQTQLLKLGRRAVELAVDEAWAVGTMRGAAAASGAPEDAELPLWHASGVRRGVAPRSAAASEAIGDRELVSSFLAACEDGWIDQAIELAGRQRRRKAKDAAAAEPPENSGSLPKPNVVDVPA